jgi:hypothetical protein
MDATSGKRYSMLASASDVAPSGRVWKSRVRTPDWLGSQLPSASCAGEQGAASSGAISFAGSIVRTRGPS